MAEPALSADGDWVLLTTAAGQDAAILKSSIVTFWDVQSADEEGKMTDCIVILAGGGASGVQYFGNYEDFLTLMGIAAAAKANKKVGKNG